ncbi:winged helix-turn-helix transcriptional regulator [Tropicimonas sp.]|uniref:winged helix-turn-helix transcriptional regulator n=1 Tax=Tropicimonas sp. TaxID=2067044 RepID=UPI003A88F2EE
MLQITALTKTEAENCPIRQILSKVTGKWQLLILFALQDGSLRFGALKRVIGDITQRVLTENLRSLERDGYLTRSVDPGPPVAVHYQLTELGRELAGLLETLAEWAARNHGVIRKARQRYDG